MFATERNTENSGCYFWKGGHSSSCMNNYRIRILKNETRAFFKVGRWNIKVVPPSDDSRRKTGHADLDADSIVQFYDNRQSKEVFGEDGQFVSSYYLQTLLEHKGGGLCLDGGVPAWTVGANDYAFIMKCLKGLL